MSHFLEIRLEQDRTPKVLSNNKYKSIQEMLEKNRGAYTGFRADESDLGFHAKRLLESLQWIQKSLGVVHCTGIDLKRLLETLEHSKSLFSPHLQKRVVLLPIEQPKDTVKLLFAAEQCFPPLSTDICIVPFGPRPLAQAKDSLWVQQRKHIVSRYAHLDLAEIVLSSIDGKCYEGILSNFFVFFQDSIQTAPSSVLEGHSRSKVLDLCQTLQLPLNLSYPNTSELSQWEGAFITSSIKGIYPIRRVLDSKGKVVKTFEDNLYLKTLLINWPSSS